MTDILTRLAVLTQKDEEVLKKPWPFCTSICGSARHDDGRFWWQCDSCSATGPAESCYSEDGDPEWNARPRETALIALVQEAAGEVERLRKLAAESRDALDAAIPCIGRDSSSFSAQYALQQAKEQRERCELAINSKEFAT
jgi:hypothetical protein